MNLVDANKIINSLNNFCKLVNDTIGLLHAEYKILDGNLIQITIIEKLKEYDNVEVSHFVRNTFIKYLKEKTHYFVDDMSDKVEICYKIPVGAEELNETVIKTLINCLYETVDEAKVEFARIIEKDTKHEIPYDVLEQLDEYNETLMENEEDYEYISDEDIFVYRLSKKHLYSLSLGYYVIDLQLLESDLVPELLGILLESVETFCYVTSYEDAEYIYFYTAKEFKEDNFFDLEEGLVDALGIIATSNPDETLDEAWSIVNEGMKKMNKEGLKNLFRKAQEQYKDIAIELTVPTRDESEIIVVKYANLDYKLEYYLNNYNDNLELERCKDIKILNAYLIDWNLENLQ